MFRSPPRIIPATVAHVHDIRCLANNYKDVLGEVKLYPLLEAVEAKSVFIVAQRTDVIGYIQLAECGGRGVSIEAICVTSGWRGKGLGRRLVVKALEVAAMNLRRFVRAKIKVELDANEFLSHVGFWKVGVQCEGKHQYNVWEKKVELAN